VTRAHVFARLSPAQKLQIIQAYQRTGMGVVMVGDGVNDVLALKVADVGIAMGRDGADLARRTADLILEDDDLSHIMVAIANGRAFYGNIQRSLRFLLTANQVDVMMEMGARAGIIGAGPGALQSVWANAVCLSLALSPPGVESEAPLSLDPERAFVKERDIKDTFKGAMGVLAGGSLSGFYGLARYGPGAQASRLFSTSVSINQLLYADTCQGRPEQDLEGRGKNPYLRATTVGVVGWQVLSLILGSLGTSLGRAFLLAFDAMALGAGCLLARELLTGRAGCRTPDEGNEGSNS
jgi:Ca2+-transporting ATPase